MNYARADFDYRHLTWRDFKSYCWIVATVMGREYGVDAKKRKLARKITGDFNGVQIILRSDIPWEMKLFILLHLFGHTVQFNTSPALRKIGLTRYKPKDINPKTLRVIRDYERMAGRYGLRLLHYCNLRFLDQWVSDWSNGDLDYLVMLYTTGAKYELTGSFLRRYKKQYIKFGTRLIKPLPIPKFTPRKWPKRASF